MKAMFVDIYAEVFTAEELQGIIKFYESPEGHGVAETEHRDQKTPRSRGVFLVYTVIKKPKKSLNENENKPIRNQKETKQKIKNS